MRPFKKKDEEELVSEQKICAVDGCNKWSLVNVRNFRPGFYWTSSFYILCAEHRVEHWWDNMKPDWISIKKICPNIPTSWYITTSNNVCYENDSRGICG